MQDPSIFWLRAAVLFYLPGLVQAVISIVRRQTLWFRPALLLFGIGAVLHLVSLVDLARELNRFPAGNFHQSISLCAFVLAGLLLFVTWFYKFESLSMFLFPLVFLMTLMGATSAPVANWNNQNLRGAWLLLHVGLAVAGYASLLIAAAASVFYLIQERRLKAKQISQRLPPLAILDNLLSRSMAIGFVLITLATIMGSVWAFIESGTRWIANPEILVAWVTWAGYLVMVYLRVGVGWRGRKVAITAICVLCISALTWATHVGLRESLLR